MYTHHKFDHEFQGGVEPRVSYMICSTPRSGSSLLCELLFNTGLAGAPTEFFDDNQLRDFANVWGTSTLDGYLEALLDKKTSPNGVFGCKAHFPQLERVFGERDIPSLLPNLRCIYITRRDQVRQAVSYARATQTNQWASDHAVLNDNPVFDADQVTSLLRQIQAWERDWERFFEENALDPLRIEYEELVERPEAVVREVLAFLDVTVPEPFVLSPPTLEKQSDELSEEWVRRYRATAPS
jgi:trehalose 2-sulfotransferase